MLLLFPICVCYSSSMQVKVKRCVSEPSCALWFPPRTWWASSASPSKCLCLIKVCFVVFVCISVKSHADVWCFFCIELSTATWIPRHLTGSVLPFSPSLFLPFYNSLEILRICFLSDKVFLLVYVFLCSFYIYLWDPFLWGLFSTNTVTAWVFLFCPLIPGRGCQWMFHECLIIKTFMQRG